MYNHQSIDKAINNALIFAAIQAVLTIVLMVIGMMDLWSIIDLVFLVICAFGIKKHSRVAAVAMLSIFTIGRVVMMLESGVSGGSIMMIFGIIIYGRAVQACFNYKKLNTYGEDDVMVY